MEFRRVLFRSLPTLLPDSLLMEVSVDRRRFLKSSGTVALAPAVATTAAAANDRIGVAIIGCGGMGRMDLTDFHKQPDVEIRAGCDGFRPAAQQARRMTRDRAAGYRDFPPGL